MTESIQLSEQGAPQHPVKNATVLPVAVGQERRRRELEERLIWTVAQGRNEKECEALFNEYVSLVERKLLHQAERITHCPHAAQDVVQESYLALYQQVFRNSFEGNLNAWLSGVVRKKALEQARNVRRQKTVSLEEMPEHHEATVRKAVGEKVDRMADALRHIDHLSEQQRQALMMRHFQGCDFPRIAAALKISPDATRKCCYRALVKVRDGALGAPSGPEDGTL